MGNFLTSRVLNLVFSRTAPWNVVLLHTVVLSYIQNIDQHMHLMGFNNLIAFYSVHMMVNVLHGVMWSVQLSVAKLLPRSMKTFVWDRRNR